jgi:hypothetical protein
MSSNNRNMSRSSRAEAKIVGVKDGEGTYHTVMMVRADSGVYPPLSDKGFGGSQTFFAVVDAGVMESHYDPRKLRQDAPYVGRNDTSYELMLGIHDGRIPWEKVEDGATIDPVDLRDMKNG